VLFCQFLLLGNQEVGIVRYLQQVMVLTFNSFFTSFT